MNDKRLHDINEAIDINMDVTAIASVEELLVHQDRVNTAQAIISAQIRDAQKKLWELEQTSDELERLEDKITSELFYRDEIITNLMPEQATIIDGTFIIGYLSPVSHLKHPKRLSSSNVGPSGTSNLSGGRRIRL